MSGGIWHCWKSKNKTRREGREEGAGCHLSRRLSTVFPTKEKAEVRTACLCLQPSGASWWGFAHSCMRVFVFQHGHESYTKWLQSLPPLANALLCKGGTEIVKPRQGERQSNHRTLLKGNARYSINTFVSVNITLRHRGPVSCPNWSKVWSRKQRVLLGLSVPWFPFLPNENTNVFTSWAWS